MPKLEAKDRLKDDPLWLFERLIDKAHDLSHAILHAKPKEIRKRAADIVAFASLIADRADSVEPINKTSARR